MRVWRETTAVGMRLELKSVSDKAFPIFLSLFRG